MDGLDVSLDELMDGRNVTIEDVEAALVSMEKPLEGENPYWHERNKAFLTNFLEFLKERRMTCNGLST